MIDLEAKVPPCACQSELHTRIHIQSPFRRFFCNLIAKKMVSGTRLVAERRICRRGRRKLHKNWPGNGGRPRYRVNAVAYND